MNREHELLSTNNQKTEPEYNQWQTKHNIDCNLILSLGLTPDHNTSLLKLAPRRLSAPKEGQNNNMALSVSKKMAESAKTSPSPKVPSKSKDEKKSSPKASLLPSILMAVVAFLGGVLTPPALHHMLHHQDDVNSRFVTCLIWFGK